MKERRKRTKVVAAPGVVEGERGEVGDRASEPPSPLQPRTRTRRPTASMVPTPGELKPPTDGGLIDVIDETSVSPLYPVSKEDEMILHETSDKELDKVFPTPIYDSLSIKEQVFIDEYLLTLNITKAAVAARMGRKRTSAAVLGTRMFYKSQIQSAIAERRAAVKKAKHISLERIIEELAYIGLSNPLELFDEDGALRNPHEIPESTARALTGLEVKELHEYVEGAGGRKTREKIGELVKVKFGGKVPSLQTLMEHLGGGRTSRSNSATPPAAGVQIGSVHVYLPDNKRSGAIDVTPKKQNKGGAKHE